MKKTSVLLLVFIMLIASACSLKETVSPPTPTPTMTATPTMTFTPTVTSTPTITPTPQGEIITDPLGAYSLYLPDGYTGTINKGICVVKQDSKEFFRGMMFIMAAFKDAQAQGTLALDVMASGWLDKMGDLGLEVEEKGSPYDIDAAGFAGRAIDFTGDDGRSVEGQIVAFAPDPDHIFLAMAWVDTSTYFEIWEDQGLGIFQFILASLDFTP